MCTGVGYSKSKLSVHFLIHTAVVVNHSKLLYIKKLKLKANRGKVALTIATQTVNFSLARFYMAAYHRVAKNIQRVKLL